MASCGVPEVVLTLSGVHLYLPWKGGLFALHASTWASMQHLAMPSIGQLSNRDADLERDFAHKLHLGWRPYTNSKFYCNKGNVRNGSPPLPPPVRRRGRLCPAVPTTALLLRKPPIATVSAPRGNVPEIPASLSQGKSRLPPLL